MISKLEDIANKYASKIKSDRGTIADAVKICSASEIIDVKIGLGAVINNPASLINGSILSDLENPTKIGTGVIAHNFIVSENSTIDGQAILENVFVGQGCQIGEQFSAKHSLFFANCEGFHGEACSVFAGPYSVSHHKSTLLIAVMMSFYNAGSGTNQSNHMYKLGPVHEGKLLRGTKTGSFSYMMWPCRTGPFSVVLGKHSGTFDIEDYPFSHLEARADGKASFVPGLHLTTVGTVRDGNKWPSRDRRRYKVKRDIINFAVFSPYTVGKMLKANKKLKELQDSTDRSIEEVFVGGAIIRRPILRMSQKFYRNGIEMYLLEKVFGRIEQEKELTACQDAVYSDIWVDIAGQLMPEQRLKDIQDSIEAGKIESVPDFYKAIETINNQYINDEWVWIKKEFEEYFGIVLDSINTPQIIDIADKYQKIKSKFLRLIIADAEKEFVVLSQAGFGQDGSQQDKYDDFEQVRGTRENNSFIKEMKENIELLNKKVEALKMKVTK